MDRGRDRQTGKHSNTDQEREKQMNRRQKDGDRERHRQTETEKECDREKGRQTEIGRERGREDDCQRKRAGWLVSTWILTSCQPHRVTSETIGRGRKGGFKREIEGNGGRDSGGWVGGEQRV